MKVCLILLSVSLLAGLSNAQTVLLFCDTSFVSFPCDDYETAFNSLGISYTKVDNRPLELLDLTGHSVLWDATFTNGGAPDCGVDWDGNTIPTFNSWISSGGPVYFQFEHENYNGCNQEKLNILNNYITDTTVLPGNTVSGSSSLVATTLNSGAQCVLNTPNDVAGGQISSSAENDFLGSIDADSSLVTQAGVGTAGIWSENEVTNGASRFILFSDINHSLDTSDLDFIHNMIEYLVNGCGPICDTSTECEGLQCGTGLCGNPCTNNCDPFFEMCVENTCECNMYNECVNAECGTGFCGGTCFDTCTNAPFSCLTDVCNDTFDGNSICVPTEACPDDGDPCTTISCQFGACYEGFACPSLGNACQTNTCVNDGGVARCEVDHVVCDDGNACTKDYCDSRRGCLVEEITCDDSDRCTSEYCDPDLGCVYDDISSGCDDGNPCTIDYCDNERGCQIIWKYCDDENPCTNDSCDESSGDCINEPIICDDGNPLTIDYCDRFGECQVASGSSISDEFSF